MSKFLSYSILIEILIVFAYFFLRYKKKAIGTNIFKFISPVLKIFYATILIFFLVFAFLATYKFFEIHFSKENFSVPILHDLVKEFDVAGMILGLIGILIGFVIVIYVEKRNDIKEQQLNRRLRNLKRISDSIQSSEKKMDFKLTELRSVSDDIMMQATGLHEIKNIQEIFLTIGKIVDHATLHETNNLYILTYAPSYGDLLINNLQVIQTEFNLKDLNQQDIFKKWSELQNKKKQADQKIKYFTKLKDKTLNQATLKNRLLDETSLDKLERFFNNRVMSNKSVHLVDESKTVELNIPEFKKPKEIFIDFEKTDSEDVRNKERFIKKILEINKTYLNEMEGQLNYMDYIPFQFFLSAPEEESSVSQWLALIIFTNYYNLGDTNSLVSFHSATKSLGSGLKKMFKELIQDQKFKDENPYPLKSLFENCKKINVVLKNIDVLPEGEDFVKSRIGYRQITPVSDIEGGNHILNLFSKYEILHSKKMLFVKPKSGELREIENSLINDNGNTYLAVGLFLNPLTEWLSDVGTIGDNPLFRLEERQSNEEKNVLKIATSGNTSEPVYQPYAELFDDKNDKSYDYAILCRLKVKTNWIFVCGGLNYFGSENVGRCLKSDNCKQIVDITGGSPFLALFKMNKDRHATLQLISFVKSDSNIECKLFHEVSK